MSYLPPKRHRRRTLVEDLLSILLTLVLIPLALGWILGAWMLGDRWDEREER